MDDAHSVFLERILERIRSYYGESLVSLVVFGSVARGTATCESDMDLLLIVRNLPNGRTARVRQFMEIEESLETEMSRLREQGYSDCLSPVIKTPEEVQSGSLLFLDMIYDRIILYDQDRFFERFLGEFKDRLDRLGARRIVQGDRWYWDLKPDYKKGEIFHI